MAYNVENIRRDFPILQRENLVFLDSAASSQKPRQVIDAMTHYYQTTHANVHRGVYALSEAATEAYEAARDKVQQFINAKSRKEIIYTRNTTEGLNLVAATWGRANLQAGDVVILSAMEHHSNLVPWQMLQAEKGFTIKYIPVLPDLTLEMEAFARFLAEGHVKLVSVTQVSNVLGYKTPLSQIIEMAHAAGALVCADSAQSVPHMPVDVQALDVDFLAFSGHKMCAPTGIGILYAKKALLEAMPPYMGGGDMIRRVTLDGSTWNDLPYKFEAGTPAIAEAIGLGAAVDYLSSVGLDNIQAHEQALVAYAVERLAAMREIRLVLPPVRSSVVTFTVEGIHPHDVAQLLDYEGVAIRAGHHCAMPLHDILQLPATCRASFYLYNTLAEVDRLVVALEKAIVKFSRKVQHV